MMDLCVGAPTRRRNQPQHGCQVHGEVSMSSLPERGKEAVRQERAISSLRDRTGAPLAEVRRLFAQEFSRLTRPLQSRRNRSPTSLNNCGTSASEPYIVDWLEDTRETL